MNMTTQKKNYAKQFGIYAILIAAAFGVVTAANSMGAISQTNGYNSQDRIGLFLPESYLGDKLTIQQAKTAQVDMKIPTALPESTTLTQVYADKDRSNIFVLYSNPTMKNVDRISSISIPKTTIIVHMEKMENNPIPYARAELPPLTITVEEEGKPAQTILVEQTPPPLVTVKVNGVDGFVLEADEKSNRPLSKISWWENNTLYNISADLSIPRLVNLAESMQ